MPDVKFNEEFDVATEPIRKKFSERMGVRPGDTDDKSRYFLTAPEAVNMEVTGAPDLVVDLRRNPWFAEPNRTVQTPRFDFSQSRMPNGSWDVGIFKVHTRTMRSELSYQIIVELAGQMSEYRMRCDQWEHYTPGERIEFFAHTLRGMASTLGRDMMEVALREMFRAG